MLEVLESPNLKMLYKVLSTYYVIQVLAQDLGIQSGKKQTELLHFLPLQILILFSSAYEILSNVTLAIIVTVMY